MILEAAVLCVVLSRSPHRCGSGEHTICADSDAQHRLVLIASESGPTVQSGDLESALAKDFALVSEIRYVLLERAEENFLVWIAADNPTREVRERIFQKELSLIEGFPEISFDFNIVASQNRKPHELASNAKVIYPLEGDIAD